MSERSVLIVDDDPQIRYMLRELLSDEGYEVREAGDGKAALDALVAWSPDVIVLDLMMPVMDGWEFRRQQAALGVAWQVPVVVLSASRDITRAGELQAAAVVRKPFDVDQLLDVLHAVGQDR